MRNPFRYFKTSPDVIRLAVMMYIRFPLSLRQVEDLLHERGIDISYETVRAWWNRFDLCKELEKEVDGQLAVLPDGMSSVLERIRVVLGQNFDEQLQVVDRMEKGSLEHMEKLRRRLVRMAKDLQLSEEEVARLREALMTTVDGGLASVYHSVQGLSTDEDNFQARSDLLRLLFEQNVDLRKSSA